MSFSLLLYIIIGDVTSVLQNHHDWMMYSFAVWKLRKKSTSIWNTHAHSAVWKIKIISMKMKENASVKASREDIASLQQWI